MIYIMIDEIKNSLAFWCPKGLEAGDLAKAADVIVRESMPAVSADVSDIKMLWVWLENSGVEIMARVCAEKEDVADIALGISKVFKCGASGAQIFIGVVRLGGFAKEFAPIRSDLFFNKKLFVGLDLAELGAENYAEVLGALETLGANGVVLTYSCANGKKADMFVGKLYGFIESLRDWVGELHFYFGQNERILQSARLLSGRLKPVVRFFVCR